MKERRKVPYGPFSTYRSSAKKENVLQTEVTGDSYNWRYNAQEAKFIERDGSTLLGQGLTEESQRFRARQILEFPVVRKTDQLPLFADGYPSYMALYGTERKSGGSGYDFGLGQVVFRTTNDADAFLTPAASMPVSPTNNTVYPQTGASYIKIIPMWETEVGPHRCNVIGAINHRSRMASGSRRMLIIGDEAYFPNLYGMPVRWNLQYNRSTETGGLSGRKERHAPIGMLPVLFPARILTNDGTTTDLGSLLTATVSPWKEFDRFFLSMCWIRSDGQWGTPFIPQLRTDAAAANNNINQFGLVTLPHQSGAGVVDYYPYVPLRGIPKAPPDCPYKAILRTPKVDGSTSAMPKTNDLRIVDVIPGDATSYDMRSGDDSALKIDDDLVRYDQIWPPRSRDAGEFDGRMGIGFTWRNPAALILAPTGVKDVSGVPANYRPNGITDDDDTALTTTTYCVEVTTSDVFLKRLSGGFPVAVGAGDIQQIALAADTTLQNLIDTINITTPASNAGEWRAALAPGADAQQLVANALAGQTIDAYGDDNLFTSSAVGSIVGNQRVISQAYPGIIYWSPTTMRAKYPNPDRSAFWHTTNTPLSAAAGVSSAPNYFLRRNRRTPPIYSGDYMGLTALTDGTILYYAHKVWLFRNTFAGRTGKDEDYRFDLLSEDGSIAWGGHFSFPGGAGWLSKKGILVTNGTPGQVVLISKALYDPDTGLGDLAAEIAECVKAMSLSVDDTSSSAPAARFHAKVIGQELIIRYRSAARIAASSGYAATDPRKYSCDIRQRYDFSAGIPGDGLGAILAPGGQAHGWGTPELKEGTVMGYYHGAAGLVKLEAVEAEGVGTAVSDGRIDQFDTGHQDNGVDIPTRLVTMMDNMGEERRRHRVRKVTLRYKSPTGHSLMMQFSRDRARASVGVDYGPFDNTGSADVGSQTKRTRFEHQSPSAVSEVAFTATRVSAGPAEIHGVEKIVDILNTPV